MAWLIGEHAPRESRSVPLVTAPESHVVEARLDGLDPLPKEGHSIRAVSRMAGRSRNTIRTVPRDKVAVEEVLPGLGRARALCA